MPRIPARMLSASLPISMSLPSPVTTCSAAVAPDAMNMPPTEEKAVPVDRSTVRSVVIAAMLSQSEPPSVSEKAVLLASLTGAT